jgi:MFS family permease
MGGASPLVGRLIDRQGARRVILVGAVAAGAGFVLLGRIDSLWQFYIIYTIIGAGIAAIGNVPSTAIVSNWFRKRRGTAIGIMSSGIGAGGLAISPLVGSYLIPTFGWRDSYLALAVITWVVIIPLALFVIRTKPAEMGLYPDGAGAPAPDKKRTAKSDGNSISPRKALALSAFWLLAISFFTGQFSSGGVTAGPLVAGLINDATGSYHWAFVTLLVLCSVAILTILMVHHPKLTPILREA